MENREELYPMEIRVVLELPESVYDEYDDLKKHRKLTQRVQKAVDNYETKDVDIEHLNRLEKLEESVTKINSFISSIEEKLSIKKEVNTDINLGNEKVIEGMEKLFNKFEYLIDKVDKKLEKLDKLDNIDMNSNSKVDPLENISKEDLIKMINLNNSNNNVNGTAPNSSETMSEEPKVERKAPDKKVSKKLNSMMDI